MWIWVLLIASGKHRPLQINYAEEYRWPSPQQTLIPHLIIPSVIARATCRAHPMCHQNWLAIPQCLAQVPPSTCLQRHLTGILYTASQQRIWDHPPIPSFPVHPPTDTGMKTVVPSTPWLHNKRNLHVDGIYRVRHPLFWPIFYIWKWLSNPILTSHTKCGVARV